MNSPAQLTRAQEQSLRAASAGEPETVRTIEVAANGQFAETVPLHENDTVLLELKPAAGRR